MSLNIVTGYTGAAHITAQQDRYINQAAFGTGTCVLPTGNTLTCTVNAATQLEVQDGAVSLQGCVGVIDAGLTETISLEDGASGMNRIDYLCAAYSKDGDGVESMSLVVKTGTASSGSPVAPSYTTGSIEGGDTYVEYPLWKITLTGLAVSSVQRVAPVVSSATTLMSSISSFTSLLSAKSTVYSFTSGDDVDTARDALSIRDVFIFKGSSNFSVDVLQLPTQTNAFGIGSKTSSVTMVFFAICGGNLYYSTYNSDGTGTVYKPVNLTSNV